MLCKKCGATNDSTARFCESCGSELLTVEEPVMADSPVVEPVVTEVFAEESVVVEVPSEEPSLTEGNPEEIAGEAPKKKGLIKKWWFWLIAGVLVAGLTVGTLFVCGVFDDDSGSSDSGSGSSTYVSPYVTMVKTARHSTYGITYGAAFDSFFSNPKWRYFEASTGEDVVEFTGGFYYDNKPATATIQFIVDLYEGTIQVYHLSINDVGQSKLMLSALVKKVFESY